LLAKDWLLEKKLLPLQSQKFLLLQRRQENDIINPDMNALFNANIMDIASLGLKSFAIPIKNY